jgi:hypothetical protein
MTQREPVNGYLVDGELERKHNLLTMSFSEVEERLEEQGQDVVLVPLGSTEKHGAHIPLGTDSYVTMEVVKRVGVSADVMYSPLVPFGYSPHHMGRHLEGAGTVTLQAETYRRIMNDVARSLIFHGFTKIVFVSHHGSNTKPIDELMRALRYQTGAFVAFYKTPTEREASVVQDIFDNPPEETPVAMVTPKKITDPAQLRGKRLGIQDVGAFREVMTRLVLQGAHLTPDDVSYRPVESNGYTGALLAGQIQSGILQQEQAIDAMAKDHGFHVLEDLYATDPKYFYGTYFAKPGWLKANTGTAERFLAAITKAHRFMYENKEETVKIVAKATGFAPKVIDEAYARLLARNAVFPVNDGLDEERLSHTLARMKQLGLLQGATPKVSDIVDRTPIDEAIKRIGGPAPDPREK